METSVSSGEEEDTYGTVPKQNQNYGPNYRWF